jgi:hypothetical protein
MTALTSWGALRGWFRHARQHEPGSNIFGYRLITSREGGIDRLPRVKKFTGPMLLRERRSYGRSSSPRQRFEPWVFLR